VRVGHLPVLKTVKFLPAIPGAPIAVNPWGGYPKIGDPSPTLCEDISEQTDKYSVDSLAQVLHYGEKF
jgi:hypothetical protein